MCCDMAICAIAQRLNELQGYIVIKTITCVTVHILVYHQIINCVIACGARLTRPQGPLMWHSALNTFPRISFLLILQYTPIGP